MKSRTVHLVAFCALSLWPALATTTQAASPTIEWIRQWGTTWWDGFGGVSVDGLGNVYFAGSTAGDLAGPNAGYGDYLIAKYDTTGDLLWMEQYGGSGDDSAAGLSADGSGNVYVTGDTSGPVGGTEGDYDVFLRKYDASGNLLWAELLESGEQDFAGSVSADGLGNVYISGYTHGDLGEGSSGGRDVFVSKYDVSGNHLWTQQHNSIINRPFPYYGASTVSADGLGNVYFAGGTDGDLGGPNVGAMDAYINKYDASGNLLWSQQLGMPWRDKLGDVCADGLGNVYITGGWSTDEGNRIDDAFVAKYDTSGDLLWTQRLDSKSETSPGDVDTGTDVWADGLGNVYITGGTQGDLGGPNAGMDGIWPTFDVFVSKYDASGDLLWTEQFGSSNNELPSSISGDGAGNLYISGHTFGSLGGENAGGQDGFLVKLSEAEPSLVLQSGDADQDYDFDQLDLVQVQVAAKYLTGESATWGEGDWNGAPGGELGSPPIGDGLFNQLDIIAAQQAGLYLTGSYAASRVMLASSENDVYTAVPEPSSLLLLLVGLGGLVRFRACGPELATLAQLSDWHARQLVAEILRRRCVRR